MGRGGARDPGGLSRFDYAQEQFRRYRHNPNEPSSLISDFVSKITASPEDPAVLWIGTAAQSTDQRGGLSRLDMATGTFTNFRHEPNDPSSLPSNLVWALLTGHDGTLWVGTNGSLHAFDRQTERFTRFQHQPSAPGIRSLYEDRFGVLWVGSNGGGLMKLERWTNPFTLYRHDAEDPNSLANDAVWPIYEDSRATGYRATSSTSTRILEGYDREWVEAGTQRMARYPRLPPGEYVFRVTAASSDGVWDEAGASLRITIHPPWWRTWWAYALYGMLLATAVFAVDRVQRRRLIHREQAKAREREKELRTEAAEARANYLQLENQRQTQELEQARALQLSMPFAAHRSAE